MAVRGGYAAKQGLDLKLPYFQNDVIALRGLLAGDLESYEGGAATAIVAASAQRRRQDHRMSLADGGAQRVRACRV
jgi:hypothetical protein